MAGMSGTRITLEMLTELLDLPARADNAGSQAFAHDVVRVLQAAVDLGNDPKAALNHVRNLPISAFENKTAWEMIQAGRTNDVVAYLRSLSAGYVG